jgi:chromosomal replication initiation ATPase DnaA
MGEVPDTLYEQSKAVARTIKGDDEFARRVLSDAAVAPLPPAGWTIEAIAAASASIEGLTIEELKRRGQAARPSRARTIAACFARREALIPVSRVASYFGRDESTLIRAVRKFEASLDSNERFRSSLDEVARRLIPKSAGVHG